MPNRQQKSDDSFVGAVLFYGAILVLVYAITLATPSLLSIGFIFERNYNEGWNVYNA